MAKPGTFVGLANFVSARRRPRVLAGHPQHLRLHIVATVLKMIGGLAMALVINQQFRGRNLARAFLLLPFIVPTVLSTIAWMWILDPTFSVINWVLVNTGAVKSSFSWLGNATLAMVAIIIVNTWRGMPFYGITLLAGLQTISPELYEAAAIDGANARQRFLHITLPIIKPVLIIVTMFSVIFTFSDFQLVYVLTHGGPANATQLFATYAFDIGMSGGQLGMGAAVGTGHAARPRPAHRRADAVPEARVMVGGRGLGARTLRLYLPLALLPGRDAVPVLLDGDHVHQAEPRAVQPEDHAADRPPADAEALRRSARGDELPHVDLQHDAGGGGHHRHVAGAGDDDRRTRWRA